MLRATVGALLLSLPLSVIAWGETELYAYRTDVKDIDFQFYKLCAEKTGPGVRLVWGESCGTGYTPQFNWVAKEEVLYLRPDVLWGLVQMQRQMPSEPWGETTAEYFGKWNPKSKTKPDYSVHTKTKSWTLKSQQLFPLSIATPKDDDPNSKRTPEWRDANFKQWKVLLQRPTMVNTVPTTPLLFDSQFEFGTYFNSFWRRKVDPVLDIAAMANPETGERFVLVACQIATGNERQKRGTSLQLYLRRLFDITGKKTNLCFPIQLTKSKNKLYHAKDLWCEAEMSKRHAENKVGFEYTPTYNTEPFIVKNTGADSIKAVVDKTDPELTYLLEFSTDDCSVWSDHKDRYMPTARDRGRIVHKGGLPQSLKHEMGWVWTIPDTNDNDKAEGGDEYGVTWHHNEPKAPIVRVYPDDDRFPVPQENLEPKIEKVIGEDDADAEAAEEEPADDRQAAAEEKEADAGGFMTNFDDYAYDSQLSEGEGDDEDPEYGNWQDNVEKQPKDHGGLDDDELDFEVKKSENLPPQVDIWKRPEGYDYNQNAYDGDW